METTQVVGVKFKPVRELSLSNGYAGHALVAYVAHFLNNYHVSNLAILHLLIRNTARKAIAKFQSR